jgi:hypothetical protein
MIIARPEAELLPTAQASSVATASTPRRVCVPDSSRGTVSADHVDPFHSQKRGRCVAATPEAPTIHALVEEVASTASGTVELENAEAVASVQAHAVPAFAPGTQTREPTRKTLSSVPRMIRTP